MPRAATAGNSASRSSVVVNRQLTSASGASSLRSSSSRISSAVASTIASAPLASACTAPRTAKSRSLIRGIIPEAMAIDTGELTVSTQGDTDVVDITAEVRGVIGKAGVANAQALVVVRGSTAAIATMEFEPGGVHDLAEMLDRLIPTDGDYEHNRLNHDTNSHAHQRATVVGPSEAVPVL